MPSSPEPTDSRTVVQRWLAIQREVEPIPKSGVNTQQHFNFRGVDQVYGALHDLFAIHGVFIRPITLERIPERRDTKGGGTMNVVHLLISFIAVGDAGDELEVARVWGEAQDNADKATSKAISIAFKFAMFTALAIPTGEDDPDSDSTPAESRPAANGFDADQFVAWWMGQLAAAADKESLLAVRAKAAEYAPKLSRARNTALVQAWEQRRDTVAAAQASASAANPASPPSPSTSTPAGPQNGTEGSTVTCDPPPGSEAALEVGSEGMGGGGYG